jgi:phospholipid-translocating ATPase
MISILEMSKITYISAIGMILSVGGWFLFTVVLSVIFKPRNDTNYIQYPVYESFLLNYGRDLSWWLSTLLIITALILFDLALTSLRKSFRPTDTDIFQELERDPIIRKRFEETVRSEAEAIDGIDTPGAEVKMGRIDMKTSSEIRREDDIQALLDRPRVMPVSAANESPVSPSAATPVGLMRRRVSTDVNAHGGHQKQQQENQNPQQRQREVVPGITRKATGNITFRHSVDIAEVLGRRD